MVSAEFVPMLGDLQDCPLFLINVPPIVLGHISFLFKNDGDMTGIFEKKLLINIGDPLKSIFISMPLREINTTRCPISILLNSMHIFIFFFHNLAFTSIFMRE